MPRLAIRDFGTALKFDGVDDTVTGLTPTVSPTPESPITISAWFRSGKDLTDSPSAQPIVAYGYYRIYLRLAGSSRAVYLRQDSSSAKQTGSVAPHLNGTLFEWHHVVGTVSFDGGTNTTMKLYLDGVLHSTTAYPVLPTTLYGYNIGSNAGWFQGIIDDVRIFDSALSQAEVENLYYQGNTTTIPVRSFKLDEGSGTVAVDSGSSPVNGTISGGATYTTDVPMKARTASTNRVTVRDFPAALAHIAANAAKVALSAIPPGWDTGHTYATWVKTGSDVGNTQGIYVVGAGGGARAGMSITSSRVRAGYYNGAAYIATSQTVPNLQPNTWYHFVHVWDGTTSKLYINGVLQSGTGNNPATAVTTGLWHGYSSVYLTGNTSQILYYQTALTSQQVEKLYYVGMIPSSPFFHWPLSEGAGTTANDTSGNGNTGTITGATWTTTDVPMKARQVAVGRQPVT